MNLLKRITAVRKKKQSEKGVALIFTLGILGLLTVLALGFASTAMLNRKISSNISNQQEAKYLARLGAERALYALSQRSSLPVSRIISKSTVTQNDENESCDGIWKLNTKLNGMTIYEVPENYKPDSDVSWEYVRDPLTANVGTKNDIIGRYAYVVVEQKGKLDPSVHFKTVDEVSTARDFGKDVNELSFGVPFATAYFPNTSSSNYSTAECAKFADLLTFSKNFNSTYSRRFFDLGNLLDYRESAASENMFEKIIGKPPTPVTSSYLAKKAKLKRALQSILGTRMAPYDECYIVKSGDSATAYQRFNLVRNWSGLAAEDLVDPAKLEGGAPDAISWLVNWQYGRDTHWTKETMKKQIAANIIQYSLGDSAPTVVDSGLTGDWYANSPTFAGVGKHPMLNEIGIYINIKAESGEGAADSASPPQAKYNPKYLIEADCGAELIDMFGLTTKKDAKVFIYGQLSFKYTTPDKAADGSIQSSYVDGSDTVTYPAASGNLLGTGSLDFASDKWSGGYTLATWAWSASQNGAVSKILIPEIPLPEFTADAGKSADVLAAMKVKEVRLYINKVVLEYDGVKRDFAMIQESSKQLKDGVSDYDAERSMDVLGNTFHFQAAWQTVDPRVNHYPVDWTLKLSDPATVASTPYPGTFGAVNTFDGYVDGTVTYTNPKNAANGDKEAVEDPAWKSDSEHLASAYMRNAPMESFWELGCISRAEPWQTLNIKKSKAFNPATGSASDQGGGTYAEGDGNILDQVKFTNDKSRFGLINLNTDEHFVLETLFYQIPFYKNLYDSTGLAPASILDVKLAANKLADAQRPGYLFSKKDSSNHDENECLACLIMKRASILPFENRSDLLMDSTAIGIFETAGKINSAQSSELKTISDKILEKLLKPADTGVALATDAEEEQLTARIMNLIAAEPYDTVYIIAVGQSIKDIGAPNNQNGVTVFKDWAGNGKSAENYSLSSDPTAKNDTYRAFSKAGYLRPLTEKEIEDSVSNPAKLLAVQMIPTELKGKIENVKKGQYDLGADRITSDAKIVMMVRKDPVTQKWKIQRMEYVE